MILAVPAQVRTDVRPGDTPIVYTGIRTARAFVRDFPPVGSWGGVNYAYLLLRGEEVIYAGASYDLKQRFRDHRSEGRDYTSWVAFRCASRAEAHAVEAAFIHRLQPKRNKQQTNRTMVARNRARNAALVNA